MSDDDKYMPATYHIKRELSELLGNPTIADKIEELIKAVIEEDRYDRSPDREYD